MIYISAISLILLFLIMRSDFKSRMIPIMYLSGEAILSIYMGYKLTGMAIMKSSLINFAIIGFQMMLLLIWVKIRESNPERSLWSKFGAGDLFMLAVSALNFSALNYLLFIVIMSIVCIISWSMFSVMMEIKDKTLPFAGFLACGLLIVRVYQISGNGNIFFSDASIINLIYGVH